MKKYCLEVCVDSVESAIEAEKGGATRLELCANLIIGGTTPTLSLFKAVKQKIQLPIHVLIRPRFGDFCYSIDEFNCMIEDVKLFISAGAEGIVIGFLLPNGDIDLAKVSSILYLAQGIPVCFHRAFDLCNNPLTALNQLESLGVHTILTSGQKNAALDGLCLLKDLLLKRQHIQILIGGGVNLETIKIFCKETSATHFHLSGKQEIESKMTFRNPEVSMGLPCFSEYILWQTHRDIISCITRFLDGIE